MGDGRTIDARVAGSGNPASRWPAAVLWDMDGTLVDTEKLWDVGLAELAGMLGGELSATARQAMVGSNMARTIDLMFEHLRIEPDAAAAQDAARWLTERTRELFASDITWRPGAEAALRAVRACGLPTALVTSTHRGLTDVALRVIGEGYFDVTVCGDEVTHNKPHPDPYLRAAALLGVNPRHCVAVEDSPIGSASAARAGCAVLVVPCELPVEPGPGLVLRSSLTGVDAQVLAEVLGAGWEDGRS